MEDGPDDELVALELEALEATYAAGDGAWCFGEDEAKNEDGADAAGAPPPSAAPPFFTINAHSPPTITVHLTPRGVGKGAAFCEATLILSAPPGYPTCAQPVAVALARARGLGDARRAALLAALEAAAGDAIGDAALGTLIEAGLDGLTALNEPEGDCALCLNPLLERAGGCCGGTPAVGALSAVGGAPLASASSAPPRDLLKLDCYHCLHL